MLVEQYRQITLGLALVGALLFGSAAAGCGSGSDDPLTKAQFFVQADAICRAANQEREEALREEATEEGVQGGGNSESVYFVTEVALPPVQSMTEDLDDLGAPRSYKREVQAIIEAFERGVARIEADPTDLTSDVAVFTRANHLAEKYGLKDCTI